jgi:drug/metabolite transporter (DMT)-like permease
MITISDSLFGDLMIFVACIFMGSGFAIQRYAMDNDTVLPTDDYAMLDDTIDDRIGPITFTGLRLLFSAIIVSLIKPIMFAERKIREHLSSDNLPAAILELSPVLDPAKRKDIEYSAVVDRDTREVEGKLKQARDLDGGWYDLIYLGGTIGILDSLAAIFQQISLKSISGGKSAFITTCYVLVVPIIEWVFPCLLGKMTTLSWAAGRNRYYMLTLIN